MFRTQLDPEPATEKITYSDHILTLGSCFAESMGSRFEKYKFKVLPNPFGVIFNPMAQFKLLKNAINQTLPPESSYLQNQQIWYHYDLHSDFSALSKEELELKIRGTVKQASEFLKRTNWLFLTFGTAIGYYLIDNNEMVANCHKVPSEKFDKKMVSQKQILQSFEDLYSSLIEFNPGLKIIITVSPVRHLKETLELNSVSKSILRISADSMAKAYGEKVIYFPAYELLLDDLRDYRFYARDMVHPNEIGEDYIWEKFCNSFIDPDTFSIMKNWGKVIKSLEHKPFHRESEAHKKFLHSTLEQLKKLQKHLDLKREIEEIEKQL